MQIETIVRSYFPPTGNGKARLKSQTVTHVDEDSDTLERWFAVGGRVKICGHLGKQPSSAELHLPYALGTPLLGDTDCGDGCTEL